MKYKYKYNTIINMVESNKDIGDKSITAAELTNGNYILWSVSNTLVCTPILMPLKQISVSSNKHDNKHFYSFSTDSIEAIKIANQKLDDFKIVYTTNAPTNEMER